MNSSKVSSTTIEGRIPQDAGAEFGIRFFMIEEFARPAGTSAQNKIVTHYEKDVNVIRVCLTGNEAAEKNETIKVARRARQTVDSHKSLMDAATLLS